MKIIYVVNSTKELDTKTETAKAGRDRERGVDGHSGGAHGRGRGQDPIVPSLAVTIIW